MRGRRPEADHRFTFHASRFTVLGSGPSTMHEQKKVSETIIGTHTYA